MPARYTGSYTVPKYVPALGGTVPEITLPCWTTTTSGCSAATFSAGSRWPYDVAKMIFAPSSIIFSMTRVALSSSGTFSAVRTSRSGWASATAWLPA